MPGGNKVTQEDCVLSRRNRILALLVMLNVSEVCDATSNTPVNQRCGTAEVEVRLPRVRRVTPPRTKFHSARVAQCRAVLISVTARRGTAA